jgi:hypothetical protein
MRSIRIENHFTHSQSVLLMNMFEKEMDILRITEFNMDKNGEDTTEIKKQISDLRTIQITMDIWKTKNYIW